MEIQLNEAVVFLMNAFIIALAGWIRSIQGKTLRAVNGAWTEEMQAMKASLDRIDTLEELIRSNPATNAALADRVGAIEHADAQRAAEIQKLTKLVNSLRGSVGQLSRQLQQTPADPEELTEEDVLQYLAGSGAPPQAEEEEGQLPRRRRRRRR